MEKCKSKLQWDNTSHKSEWPSSKKIYKQYMLKRMWRERSIPILLVAMWIGVATMENNMEIPWKPKNRATIWPSNPTPGHISREKHVSKGYMHSNIYCSTIAIAKACKQPKCLFTDEWIRKMWYICTIQYYSAI